MGRVQEAIAENQKALELDPLSLPINNFMGMTYYFAGDYEESYRQFQHTIGMDPNFPLAHQYFYWLLIAMGRYEQAIQEYQKRTSCWMAPAHKKRLPKQPPCSNHSRVEGKEGFGIIISKLPCVPERKQKRPFRPARWPGRMHWRAKRTRLLRG